MGLIEVMCHLIGCNEKDTASFPANDAGNHASESWGQIRQTHINGH